MEVKETRLNLPTTAEFWNPGNSLEGCCWGPAGALTGWSPYSWVHGCHSRSTTSPLTNTSPARKDPAGQTLSFPPLFNPSAIAQHAMGPVLMGAMVGILKRQVASSFLVIVIFWRMLADSMNQPLLGGREAAPRQNSFAKQFICLVGRIKAEQGHPS